MNEAWRFRPGTLDRAIFNGVFGFNEYQLPERFASHDVVIDVGAHIGSFAEAAVIRGSENVYSIEPDRTNFEIAVVNLRPHIEKGYVQLVQGAAWRSDPNEDELYFDGYHPFPKSFAGMEGILNTGSGSVIWAEGEPVTKIAFDEIVDAMTNRGEKRVRFLKLDCEGAEWPILLTSRRLDLVDEISGEFHELGGEFLEISEDRSSKEPVFFKEHGAKFTVEVLAGYLERAGFAFKYQRHKRPTGEPEGLGLFFATRAGSEEGPNASANNSR